MLKKQQKQTEGLEQGWLNAALHLTKGYHYAIRNNHRRNN